MKQSKFRAFDTALNKMVVTGFHVIGEVTMFDMIQQHLHENMLDSKSTLHALDRIIISEWTTKQDGQGTDVYEGDIIEFDHEEWGDMVSNIHIVTWDDEYAEWNFGGGNVSDMEYRKVIGNIFETPHLIPNESI